MIINLLYMHLIVGRKPIPKEVKHTCPQRNVHPGKESAGVKQGEVIGV
jgi:hypothetical protein